MSAVATRRAIATPAEHSTDTPATAGKPEADLDFLVHAFVFVGQADAVLDHALDHFGSGVTEGASTLTKIVWDRLSTMNDDRQAVTREMCEDTSLALHEALEVMEMFYGQDQDEIAGAIASLLRSAKDLIDAGSGDLSRSG